MRCPLCDKETQQAFRPFCSERCKLRDLGNWASGTYAVPTENLSTDDDADHISDAQDEAS